jgi:small ligand-binding sensory domain FIST
MTAFAAGLSENPELVQAVQEAVGQVLAGLGPGGPPDLALLFVTPHHRSLVPEAAKFVLDGLKPGTLLGCAAQSVIGGSREIERTPGVALWAGRTGPATPFHLDVIDTPDGLTIAGWPDGMAQAAAMVVLADPFSFPVPDLLERIDETHPELPVIGGMAQAGTEPGENQLVVDDRVVDCGAVGVLLGPDVEVVTVVSQGCRPVGDPFIVTRAEGPVVFELGGKPPLDRLKDVAAQLGIVDRALLNRGLHLGRVINEFKDHFERGDFLIRTVVAGDTDTGAIQIDDIIEVGATAQFQVRDAEAADEDLRQLISNRQADGALLFTCNGRGRRLFGRRDHDATLLCGSVPGGAVAGMFCAGEIGPVGGRNFLHAFTASAALLTLRDGGAPP